jgi:hypothetical protein
LDTSRKLRDRGQTPLVLNPGHPITPGGVIGGGTLTENFTAWSGGLTYRADPWSWNARWEDRNGEFSDRRGLTTDFLRQTRSGVALGLSAQGFRTETKAGAQGWLANTSLAWAHRPLGSHWSLLERLEFRYDQLKQGTGISGDNLFGYNSLNVVGHARSRRFINNIVLNRVSKAWTPKDLQGNILTLNERTQWSFYYGAKYVLDSIQGIEYKGYSHMPGLAFRHDVTRHIDVGLRGSLLHVMAAKNFDYSWGPTLGFTPMTNAWISLGYNVEGFRDHDFEKTNTIRQGPYMTLRIKFDQGTMSRGTK